MFKKDSGAHFTYNLGVSLMRFSLFFFLWALVIFAEWYFLSSPKFVKEDTATVRVENFVEVAGGRYMAILDVATESGARYTHTEYATKGLLEDYRIPPFTTAQDCKVYRLLGRGADKGTDYGIFITDLGKSLAEWQYYLATPGARPPVQTWGIWVSLAVSVILFAIGRRQIRLAMKYPRSDVPFEITGAPAPARRYTWESYPMTGAKAEKDMAAAKKILLTDTKAGGEAEDGRETDT